MRQVPSRRGRMSRDTCAWSEGSVLSPGFPEACSASDGAGHALDTPSCQANSACEGSGGMVGGMNNIHRPGR